MFHGSASGIANGTPGTAVTQLESNQAGALLADVAGAGDVNGDGYSDVVVGADAYDNGNTDEGAAFVFLGSATGILDGNPVNAHAQLESNQTSALLGGSVSSAGDVNGDGYADLIVGAEAYDNGQVDPNISSQYDLIELLGNRIGPLPQDRPHYIKLDGYYTFDFKKAGQATVGIRLRALSGIPQNALAGHYLYGSNEAFLLPRGQLGRTDFEHGLDVHLGDRSAPTREDCREDGDGHEASEGKDPAIAHGRLAFRILCWFAMSSSR